MKFICSECINDKIFSNWILENGKSGLCSYDKDHGKDFKIIQVEIFAAEVDRRFRENYQIGKDIPQFDDSDKVWYEQAGDSYTDILSEMLECSDDVLSDICDNLPDASIGDLMDGAQSFYHDDCNYESIAEAENRAREDELDYWYKSPIEMQWNEFCKTVKFKRRFFKTENLLNELFGDKKEYEEGKIKPLYILSSGETLYRARVLDNNLTAQQINTNPSKELSAPSPDKTKSGRMNVEFIPVFYGAFNQYTAIAELKPSIGDEVAIGHFTLKNQIVVFDFTVFNQVSTDGATEHSRYKFITELQDEISKLIRPIQQPLEYIPTQIVAEYLREYLGCEGIIYKSSMNKNIDEDNRNIAIFGTEDTFVGSATSLLEYKDYDISVIEDITYKIQNIYTNSTFENIF